MSATRTFELLERIGHVLQAELRAVAGTHGILPGHVSVLAYLDRANRFSNTLQGLVEYQGTTKGSLSQTLKVLSGKGLIKGTPDRDDKRVVHYALTAAGRRVLLTCHPPERFREALASVSRDTLSEELEQLLARLIDANGGKAFGVCHTCMHFDRSAGSSYARCRLLDVPLSREDSTKICRENVTASE